MGSKVRYKLKKVKPFLLLPALYRCPPLAATLRLSLGSLVVNCLHGPKIRADA